jgi:hypothetical protein
MARSHFSITAGISLLLIRHYVDILGNWIGRSICLLPGLALSMPPGEMNRSSLVSAV